MNENQEIIYIGKAINLKNRVNSYFSRSTDKRTKLNILVPQIKLIGCIFVNTEFEALLLEAKLIRNLLPKFNTLLRDDKHPIYVVITKDQYPKIFTMRKNDIDENKHYIYGPFQSARIVRELLKQIRYIIPYCNTKSRSNKNSIGCFYTNIGLCNPCPEYIKSLDEDEENKTKMTKEYLTNLKMIKSLFDGKSRQVVKELTRLMNIASRELNFEKAAKLRDSINVLNSILLKPIESQNYINNANLAHEVRIKGLEELNDLLQNHHPVIYSELTRIEAYDISTQKGKCTTGAQVVMHNAEPLNSDYRKYKISNSNQHADNLAMGEMLKRRFNHHEWDFPNLIIIDGGRIQLDAVKISIPKLFWEIPIIGLTKKFETIIIPQNDGSYKELSLSRHSNALKLIQLIRDEAHRFAGKYQKYLYGRNLINH